MAQILSTFKGFGHQELMNPHLSNFRLPKSQNYCIPLHLIQWSSSYLTIYGVDHFEILGFSISQLVKTRFFPFGFLGPKTPSDSHMFPPMDSPDEFGLSRIAISTFLCNSKGFLNPVHVF